MVSESSSPLGGEGHNDSVLREMRREAVEIPVLAKGHPPTNGVAWKRAIVKYLQQADAEHLVKADWSVQATALARSRVVDDKMTQLAAKREAEAKAAEGQQEGPEKDNKVKKEADDDGDLVPKMKDLRKGATLTDSLRQWGTCFYMDPLTDEVETARERLLRRIVCEKIMASTDEHHAYLMTGLDRGDLAGFMEAAAVVIDGHDASRILAAMAGLINLKKKNMKASEFVAKAATYRQVIASSDFKVEEIIREAVLQALATDQQYAIEVSLARNNKMPLDVMLNTVMVKSSSVEVGGGGAGNSGLKGLAAAVDIPRRPKPVCFNMRDEGKCQFGDKCKFSHDLKNATKNNAANIRKNTPAFTGCYECGEAHSISECKVHADRKETEAALKAELAEAKALVAKVEHSAVGSMAKINFPEDDEKTARSTAESVWGVGH
jgi:hypothetical protein